LVGISGIDISSRIRKVFGGWDAKEASILHRHPLMGNMEVVIPLSLVCISSKINGIIISPQKSPDPQLLSFSSLYPPSLNHSRSFVVLNKQVSERRGNGKVIKQLCRIKCFTILKFNL